MTCTRLCQSIRTELDRPSDCRAAAKCWNPHKASSRTWNVSSHKRASLDLYSASAPVWEMLWTGWAKPPKPSPTKSSTCGILPISAKPSLRGVVRYGRAQQNPDENLTASRAKIHHLRRDLHSR